MDTKVTLSATTLVTCDGERYGVGMQFEATPADAQRLIDSGQAVRAEPKAKPPAAPPDKPAAPAPPAP